MKPWCYGKTILWLPLAVALVSGCRVTPPVIGLKPIYPAVRYGLARFTLNAYNTDYRTVPVEIDSVQPTLRWEPLRYESGEGTREPVSDSIDDLAYDLKIWEEHEGKPDLEVYARIDLPAPCHALEAPLKLSTKYCWSIRARFYVNGQPRVGQWSYSRWLDNAFAPHPANPRSLSQIPSQNYFRFQTPRNVIAQP